MMITVTAALNAQSLEALGAGFHPASTSDPAGFPERTRDSRDRVREHGPHRFTHQSDLEVTRLDLMVEGTPRSSGGRLASPCHRVIVHGPMECDLDAAGCLIAGSLDLPDRAQRGRWRAEAIRESASPSHPPQAPCPHG